MNKPVQVMKFGGTSVGNAECIARTAQILKAASANGPVVGVVSAMSGITNKLIEAAKLAETGERDKVTAIFDVMRQQHDVALRALIPSADKREPLAAVISAIFSEGEQLCKGTSLLRELTPRTLDTISSLGERLSAPMVAGAIRELGVQSEAIDATKLIVTDPYHGGADPIMARTREACAARLKPMLEAGLIPVVTGFIGATEEGVLTTLGRGGSDYSATILGAAIDADEIIIWTDVNGVLTADPRLVADAQTIPEISYREASELAYFGAKVLHPKTLRAVVKQEIPVWIRNSFTPAERGTKITPKGRSNGGGVKALTAIKDVTLISIGGPGIVGVPDVVGRTFSTTAEVKSNVLLISQSSSQNDICFIVPSPEAKLTVDALKKEFAQDVAHEKVEHITVAPNIAIVAVIGENMRGAFGVAGRVFIALGREHVNVIAIAQGSSESNISFVVEEKDMKNALLATHREFGLAAHSNHESEVRVSS
jgi:aspartokinase/homoserine dehydrogenase 1